MKKMYWRSINPEEEEDHLWREAVKRYCKRFEVSLDSIIESEELAGLSPDEIDKM